jgi:hypothetical protein
MIGDARDFHAIRTVPAQFQGKVVFRHWKYFSHKDSRKTMTRFYNSTKKRTLEIFQYQTWIDVPRFARKASIRPVRRAYSYLAHLEGLGLLARGYTAARKLHYRITRRGLGRLEWLRSQEKTSTPSQLNQPTLGQFMAALFPKNGTEKKS